MTIIPDDVLPENYILFLESYIEDPNIAKACRAAGFSENNSSQTARRILSHPLAKKYLEEANKQAADRLGITAMKVLSELSKIAFATPGDVVSTDSDGDPEIKVGKMEGTEVSITSTSGKDKAKITSIKTIKNSDKIAALGLLMRSKGMLKERVEVESSGSLLELIEKSFKIEDK